MQAAFKNLGMNFSQPAGSGTQGLDAEVDNYLAGISHMDTDCISFWEVCCISYLINTHLHDFRKTRIDFQLYSS